MSTSEINEQTDRRAEHWAGIMRCVTTDGVQTGIGTKQALLPAVPAGRKRIVAQAIMRNASGDLSGNAGQSGALFGFAAGANDWGFDAPSSMQYLIDDASFIEIERYSEPLAEAAGAVGVAAEIFGVVFQYTAIEETVSIDVFYYDVPA